MKSNNSLIKTLEKLSKLLKLLKKNPNNRLFAIFLANFLSIV
jgi:hypothetical protein